MYNNGNGNGVQYTVPMIPAGYGYGYGNGGNGMDVFGGGYWLMFLLLMMCGWGGNGMMGGMNGLYPWMNQANQTNEGFRDQFLNNQLNTIQQNQNNNAMDAIRTDYQGQINALQRSFEAQTANTAGLNGVQWQISNNGSETRAAIADLKYTIANEGCQTRANSDANRQAVMDKLCQLELDNVKAQYAQAQREIVGLQNALNMSNMERSQVAQSGQIIDGVYNRLRDCPIDSTPVFGRTPIFTCTQNLGQNGCGCNGGFSN